MNLVVLALHVVLCNEFELELKPLVAIPYYLLFKVDNIVNNTFFLKN